MKNKIQILCLAFSLLLIITAAYGFKTHNSIISYTVLSEKSTCTMCSGSGKCNLCKGSGQMTCIGCNGSGMAIAGVDANGKFCSGCQTCGGCNGSGKISCGGCFGNGNCMACSGRGYIGKPNMEE